MDDVPPGPTSQGPRRPALSVVIPVFNGGLDFGRCLLRLRASHGPHFELIVVDDGSTDGSADLARSFGARVIRHESPGGPALARNAGAQAATADVVFFLDADVAVHPHTISRALDRFDADPGLTALFGSYDDRPDAPGVVSRFRNLLHHFVHQQGTFKNDLRPAHTFWTGCGAIRRRTFLDAGGFDPRLYEKPAIEDIELGYRLTLAGRRIVLARDVQATHLKRWTLASIVRTDVLQRGVPWLMLMKRLKVMENDLNVRRGQKVCVVLAGLFVLSLLAAPWLPASLALTALCASAVVILNAEFYRFLARTQGVAFASASVPLHLLYYNCCGVSVVLALALWHAGPRALRRGESLPTPWLFRARARRAAADRAAGMNSRSVPR